MKAVDDTAVGRFWAEALGWEVSGGGDGATAAKPAGFDWLDPVGLCVDVRIEWGRGSFVAELDEHQDR